MERFRTALKIMAVGLVLVAIAGLLTNWFTSWGAANDAFQVWEGWVDGGSSSSVASIGSEASSL